MGSDKNLILSAWDFYSMIFRWRSGDSPPLTHGWNTMEQRAVFLNLKPHCPGSRKYRCLLSPYIHSTFTVQGYHPARRARRRDSSPDTHTHSHTRAPSHTIGHRTVKTGAHVHLWHTHHTHTLSFFSFHVCSLLDKPTVPKNGTHHTGSRRGVFFSRII